MGRKPAEASAVDERAPQAGWRMFATGLSLTLGNPKIMVFHLALLPTLVVDVARLDLVGRAELAVVQITVMAFVDLSRVAGRARRFLASEWVVRLARRPSERAVGGAVAAIATRARATLRRVNWKSSIPHHTIRPSKKEDRVAEAEHTGLFRSRRSAR